MGKFTELKPVVTNLPAVFSVFPDMRRTILTGFAVAALVGGSVGFGPLRQVPATAQRFVCYLGAMEQSGQDLSFWDRVTYGLILAGSNDKKKGGPRGLALL